MFAMCILAFLFLCVEAQQSGFGTSESGFQDGQLETPWLSSITHIEPTLGSVSGGTRVTVFGSVSLNPFFIFFLRSCACSDVINVVMCVAQGFSTDMFNGGNRVYFYNDDGDLLECMSVQGACTVDCSSASTLLCDTEPVGRVITGLHLYVQVNFGSHV